MPKTKRAKLEAKLDKLFSLYIRLRDAKDEFCTCVTCGKTKHYKDGIHCGHFQSRRHKATRWNEKNAHPQCAGCNTFNQGEQYKHALYIDKRYGKGTADEMVLLSNTSVKWSIHELECLIDDYEKRLNKFL
jgi:hypothetical protein